MVGSRRRPDLVLLTASVDGPLLGVWVGAIVRLSRVHTLHVVLCRLSARRNHSTPVSGLLSSCGPGNMLAIPVLRKLLVLGNLGVSTRQRGTQLWHEL